MFWRAMFGVKYMENRGEKNWIFFLKNFSDSIFWRVENGSRGLNRLGVKKSFVSQIVRVPK